MLDSSMFSLLLSTCFCPELVEGVILSNFYSLGFITRWVASKILETALSPNVSLSLWAWTCQFTFWTSFGNFRPTITLIPKWSVSYALSQALPLDSGTILESSFKPQINKVTDRWTCTRIHPHSLDFSLSQKLRTMRETGYIKIREFFNIC